MNNITARQRQIVNFAVIGQSGCYNLISVLENEAVHLETLQWRDYFERICFNNYNCVQ